MTSETRPGAGLAFGYRVLLATLIVLSIGVVAMLVWNFSSVLLLLFAAILLAIFLRGLANQLSERFEKIGPGAALGIVLLGLLLVAGGVGLLMAPRVAAQSKELAEALPSSWGQLQEYVRTLPFGDHLADRADRQGAFDLERLISNLPAIFSVTLGSLVQFFFIVVVAIYLAAKPSAYVQGIMMLLPKGARGRGCEVFGAIGYTLQWWLIGQVIIMTFVGAATATVLALLGIPLALTLGIIAGVLDFVPNIGPIVAAVPAILVALLSGPEKALYVAIAYIVIQQMEGYVLSPIVHRKTVSLEPALTISAQLAFGLTMGALGVLLATPLTAAALVAVKMLYVEDVLGDDVDVAGAGREGEACPVDTR